MTAKPQFPLEQNDQGEFKAATRSFSRMGDGGWTFRLSGRTWTLPSLCVMGMPVGASDNHCPETEDTGRRDRDDRGGSASR